MDKENIIIRLGAQADVIKANVNRLKKSSYNIHLLDVDLLRQKTIEFYDQILKLELLINENTVLQKNDSSISESFIEEVKVSQKIKDDQEESAIVEEPKIIEEVEFIEETSVNEPVIPDEPELIVEPDVIEPPLPEEVLETIISEPVRAPEILNETEKEVDEISMNKETDQIQSQQTTYDLFSENTESPVAEKFRVSEEQNIAERMQKTSISNIREAIGINEKFLFINELFNGDLGRYNKILDDINDLPTKKGVDTYLLELKIQFQWADDNAAFMKLNELLDRKFS